LRRLIDGIQSGRIRALAIDTPEPSFFSHEILNANPYAYLDDAPLEERRARAVQLRKTLRADVSDGAGILDPAAIAQVASEIWPDVRDADELHDALVTVIAMPPQPQWQTWFDELVRDRRAFILERGGKQFWVPVERRDMTGDATAVLRGWLEVTGPATVTALSDLLAFSREDVEIALATLEAQGQVLRGRFTQPGGDGETEWCNRRVLARIHRATLGRLRREIEPVTAAQFHAFLQRWQHVAAGAQLHGADGLLAVIRQLQGYEIPAVAWESQVLRERVARYEPDLLDELCLSGEVMWGRISPHPALESEGDERRIRPTRIAPVSLFLREDAAWLVGQDGILRGIGNPATPATHESALSHAGREVLAVLEQQGASFFADLARATKRLPSEVEDALWELVAAGLVTADGFENLRALLDPKRRRGEGRGRRARPRNAAGRWALLRRGSGTAPDVEKWAQQLLLRWGVMFRDLLAREAGAPPWRELLVVMRRLEAQGQIRGGRFVAGFTGEQFARPEAIDVLRAVRRAGDAAVVHAVANTDPLNLTGIILPGPRVSPLLSRIPDHVPPHPAEPLVTAQ
jgi:ATP-dependent Lhr-like helicase